MLTYTKEIRTVEHRQEELQIPTSWAMFTSAGNRSITNKAKVLVRKLKRLDEGYSWETRKKKLNAFAAFFRSCRRMGDTKSYGEATDTAVRECIWCFAEKAAKCVGIDWVDLDTTWEEHYW
jgi:hypothetical protein